MLAVCLKKISNQIMAPSLSQITHLQRGLFKRSRSIIGGSPFFVYCDSKSLATMSSNNQTLSVDANNHVMISRRQFSSTNKDDFDYQYLEKSILPTMKFQKSLPRLPIPKLDKTISRYLSALEPIIQDKDQYNNTVKIANEFKDKEGHSLNEKLVNEDKSNKHTSYISKPWFDMYLKSRAPLVLNFNPFMAWKDDPNDKFMRVDVRASNMIISALRFRRSLLEGKASPEVFHLNPKKSDTLSYRYDASNYVMLMTRLINSVITGKL